MFAADFESYTVDSEFNNIAHEPMMVRYRTNNNRF